MVKQLKLVMNDEDYNKFKEFKDKSKAKNWLDFFMSLVNKEIGIKKHG